MNLHKKAKCVSVYFAAHCPDSRKNQQGQESSQEKLTFLVQQFETNYHSKKRESILPKFS